jgi:transposase
MDILIPFDSEVRTFDELFGFLDIRKYLVSGKEKGRLRYNPVNMLKLILFCHMEKIHSLRNMSKAAQNDIRIMWLIDEMKPSHQAIKRFMDDVLKDSIEDIFYDLMHQITTKDSVGTEILHIDGTKIEANANRYQFVWKKTILKNKAKLDIKIENTIRKLNDCYASEGISFLTHDHYESTHVNRIKTFLEQQIERLNVTLVYGKGTRKTPLQRDYDDIKAYESKMIQYERALEIMGPDRNSYAKTDESATYMRMKDDHMRNGQLKAGYNVQIGVSDEYIMHVEVFQNRSDYQTLIPFLERYNQVYGSYPRWPVADAGYGGLLNYRYMKLNDMELTQKYGMYQKDTHDKKHIENPYRAQNFRVDKNGNYLCPQGRKMILIHTKKSGQKIYESSSCLRCPLAKDCKKGKGKRRIEVSEELWGYQKEARDNLKTEFGIELRVQRSIQVEGAFGILKEDFKFRRFRRRGMKNVKFELILIVMGYNLAKFHNKRYRLAS